MSLGSEKWVVIDTNWALDLWVFDDPCAHPLRQALLQQQLTWIATEPMRAEFHRVLSYPAVTRALAQRSQSLDNALALFDGHHHPMPVAPPCGLRCQDPDDQMFIDLAVAHGALLLSKDRAVLRLRPPLSGHGVDVRSGWKS